MECLLWSCSAKHFGGISTEDKKGGHDLYSWGIPTDVNENMPLGHLTLDPAKQEMWAYRKEELVA